ncbi:ABC transporter substrate-binding protein [Ammoniphilus sp. 3BR4]|uniref:ABC transporter substrate-binding protein n=1 Tax=Ammoniphilus sp. 3BR4 TaxID=3158265 RepID=UPI003466D782
MQLSEGRNRFRLLVQFLLLMGLLSGCGGEPEVSPDAPAAASGDKSPVAITIGYQSPTAQTWGALIIKNQQLYEKHLKSLEPDREFKVEWFDSPSGPPLNNGMIGGKIQMAFMGDMPLLSNGSKGQTEKNYRSVLLAFDGKGEKGKNQSVMVPNNGVESMEDLKGKSVSVPLGSSAHRMMLAALEKYGLSDEVEVVDHSVTVGMQSVEQNKIAAHATWEPYPTLMEHNGTGKLLLDGLETEIDYLDGIVADLNWVESHPEYTVAFLKALMEAHQFIQEKPEEAAKIFAEESKFPLEVCAKLVESIRFDAALYQRDLKTLQGSVEFLIELGKLKDLDLEKFADDSYLRKAAEEMGKPYLSDEELKGDWIGNKLF